MGENELNTRQNTRGRMPARRSIARTPSWPETGRFQMTRTLLDMTRLLTAPLIAAVVSGCYTAAPTHHTYHTVSIPPGYVSYQSPTGSVGVAVFTSPPRSPVDDGSIWYYGNHPHHAEHALGPFCQQHGSHGHDYAPYRNHRYAFHDGHYFWVGNVEPYALSGPSYVYLGNHPHPHYFGGYCRIRGLHRHRYAPRLAAYYRMKSGAYIYTGVYDSDYDAERDQQDARQSRGDHRVEGDRGYERAQGEGRFVGPDPVVQPDSRQRAAERVKSQKLTPRKSLERDRERTLDGWKSAPANAAPE
jgi:hypothetical protein